MKTIEVFDPPMCCSTGVCGPEVDPALVNFASLLEQAKAVGWIVNRFNLNQEPLAFLENESVKVLLEKGGVEALPAVYVNGELKTNGSYPSEVEWKQLLNAKLETV